MMAFLRKLLIFSIFAAIMNEAHAIPVSRIYGDTPRDGFIKNYFLRLYSWHQPHFEKYLSTEEKQWIQDWAATTKHWGHPIDNSQLFPYFSFSQSFEDGNLQQPSLSIALTDWPKPLKEKLLLILKKRQVSIKPELTPFIFGIAWHPQTQTTEVFYLHTPEKPLPAASTNLPLRDTDAYFHPQRLYSESYDRSGKKVVSTMNYPLKTVNWRMIPPPSLDALSAQRIEDSKGKTQWKMDLRSLESTLLPPLTAKVAKSMSKTFLLAPDSLIYTDLNNHTLFYP